MYDGHTTRLIPYKEKGKTTALPSKRKQQKMVDRGEQLLILMILFLFSVNVAMILIKSAPSSGIVDGIPTPDFAASIGQFLLKLFNL